jgi:uncharacterized membrane protein YphA (DoxX/SURF4 family)
MEQSSKTTAAYWVTTVLAALLFAVPGIADIVGLPHFAAEARRLGYPDYFLALLGVWKILGAVVIVLPGFARLKEWAYAGMIIDIGSAVVSRAVMGDPAVMMIVPCVIGAVVMASWALRPASRRLVSEISHAGRKLASPAPAPAPR